MEDHRAVNSTKAEAVQYVEVTGCREIDIPYGLAYDCKASNPGDGGGWQS